jgi:hypothetical protein
MNDPGLVYSLFSKKTAPFRFLPSSTASTDYYSDSCATDQGNIKTTTCQVTKHPGQGRDDDKITDYVGNTPSILTLIICQGRQYQIRFILTTINGSCFTGKILKIP